MGVAHVYMNEVEVGSIPEGQYRSIVAATKRDYRLYLLQLLVLLKFGIKLLVFSFCSVTSFLIFLLMANLILFPDDVIHSLSLLTHYSPADLIQSFRKLFITTWVMIIPVIPVFFSAKRFGLYNCFSEKINYEIRQLLEVPTEGQMRVFCYEIKNGQP